MNARGRCLSQQAESLESEMRTFLSRASTTALIGAAVLFAMLPISPMNMPLTWRDSGVFLYTGWRILNGQVPYLDVWDHKPPLIFYINAIGLAVSGGSRWGVWCIEFLFVLLAALICYKLIKDAFNTPTAIFVTFIWLLSLIFVIQGGNLVAEYALPLQFGCFWLAYDAERRGSYAWRGYLIGMLCGALFLLKQNAIGIGLSIAIYIAIDRFRAGKRKKLISDLFPMFSGGLVTLLIAVIYFAASCAIKQFWDAAFVYNFVYSSTTISRRLASMISGLESFTATGLTQLALAGWAAGLIWLFWKKDLAQKHLALLAIGVINLPIELVLTSISGQEYGHYYMALLPVFALFAGLAYWILSRELSRQTPKIALWGFTLIVIASIGLTNFRDYRQLVRTFSQAGSDDRIALVDYIRSNTAKDDFVLVLGAETTINFYAQRPSPTRFVYQFPLYKPGYATREMTEEFFQDVIQNEPKLIIDPEGNGLSSDTLAFTAPSADELSLSDTLVSTSPRIEESIRIIQSKYAIQRTFGSWVVYAKIEE